MVLEGAALLFLELDDFPEDDPVLPDLDLLLDLDLLALSDSLVLELEGIGISISGSLDSSASVGESSLVPKQQVPNRIAATMIAMTAKMIQKMQQPLQQLEPPVLGLGPMLVGIGSIAPIIGAVLRRDATSMMWDVGPKLGPPIDVGQPEGNPPIDVGQPEGAMLRDLGCDMDRIVRCEEEGSPW